MEISKAFDEIYSYAHMWNWGPDWVVLRRVYQTFPDSYALLTPFAYSYLEELIRSTTSEYGRQLFNKDGSFKNHRKVGIKLIELAITENKLTKPEFVKILTEIKLYFAESKSTDLGNNRNSVVHGYMHPRYWNQESFETLIFNIGKVSKYAGF